MTEQQIRDGYEQLGQSLRPPLDAHDRVTRRVRQRRQRRRMAVAGAAVVGVVGVGGAVAVLGPGGDDTSPQVAVDPPSGVSSTLELTRPDGSTYSFANVTVSCTSPFGDQGPAGERIYLVSPREGEGGDLTTPFVYVEGIVEKLQGERTFDLPVDGPGGSSSYPLTLFVADTEGSDTGNEVSSATDSSGTVRVLRAECEPTPVLELEVDATLGSEEGLQPLTVTGAVR